VKRGMRTVTLQIARQEASNNWMNPKGNFRSETAKLPTQEQEQSPTTFYARLKGFKVIRLSLEAISGPDR